jgi:hypothetical protein
MTNDKMKLEMSKPIRDFTEKWFNDFITQNDCKTHSEFLDRLWGLYSFKNDADVDRCCRAANDSGLIVLHTHEDVRCFLADYASDFVFDLYEKDLLPDKYANIYQAGLLDMQ